MNKYVALDEDAINDLLEAMNNKNKLLEVVNEMMIHQYYLAYDDGYTRGEQSVYEQLCMHNKGLI